MLSSLVLAVALQGGPPADTDDPLHARRVLELSAAEPVMVSVTPDFDGRLHVWVAAADVDPSLAVLVDGATVDEDDDSGGGTTAWVALDVASGDALELRVTCGDGERGAAELHWVAAPETEATRAACEAADEPLAEVEEMEDRDAARARLARAFDVLRAPPGAVHSAGCLNRARRLGVRAHALGALELSRACFEWVDDRSARLLPPEHPSLMETRGNLAALTFTTGDIREGIRLLREVLEVQARTLPRDSELLLSTRTNLAIAYEVAGDVPAALELRREVLAVQSEGLGADHPQVLASRLGVANLEGQLGRLAEALVEQEEIHARAEELLPPGDALVLDARSALSQSRFLTGDLEGAHALNEEVYAARVEQLPADHPQVLSAMQNLSITYEALGERELALELDEQVLEGRRRRLPPTHPDLLAAQTSLAESRLRAGDAEGSLTLYEAALNTLQSTLPPGHPRILHAAAGVAGALFMLGQVEEADRLYEQVHALRERQLPADHPYLLQAKSNWGATRLKLGDLDTAGRLLEEVRTVRADTLPEHHPDRLATERNLAVVRFQQGHVEEALASFEAMQRSRVALVPADHPERLDLEYNLAFVARAAGDAERAREIAESLVRALVPLMQGAAWKAPRDARAVTQDALERLASLELLCDVRPEVSFEILETARHLVSSPEVARAAALDTPEAVRLRQELRRAERRVDQLASQGAPADDEQRARLAAAVKQAAMQRDRKLQNLLALLPRASTVSVTAARVAAALPAGAVALSFNKRSPWEWVDGRPRLLPPHYVASALDAEGRVTRVDLGEARAIEDLVGEWRARIDAPIERGVTMPFRDADTEPDAGRALRRRLLDPVLEALELADDAVIFLCLDDALYTVPFEALPLPEGASPARAVEGDVARLGDRWFVRNELSFGRLLTRRAEPRGAVSVLAVGDVEFGDARERSTEVRSAAAALPRWTRLSATAAEVRELSYQAERYLDVEPVELRGDEVTLEALAAALPGKHFVHFATHGWFLSRPERRSVLDQDARADASPLGRRRALTGFAPLTLCGLVLSGANDAVTEAELAERLLTAQELATLDMTDCRLAVLSACETHVGIARAGQGIHSLQTGLHRAGARASITSLWAVRDWPTQTLMKRFYDGLWKDGLTKADALWRAKSDLRREGQPPLIWAGWILAGDPD